MQTKNITQAMKKILFMLVFVISCMLSNNILAQGPGGSGPPPPPGGGGSGGGPGHGQSGNQGAPIGGGLELLVALGLAYVGKKVYQLRKEENNELSQE